MSRTIGCVKWFNNETGFGFITVSDGDLIGKDIFVHHSAIKVTKDQFKYLVQGEYVEFDVVPAEKHEYQASVVSGIRGGSLMCETQNAARAASSDTLKGKGKFQKVVNRKSVNKDKTK